MQESYVWKKMQDAGKKCKMLIPNMNSRSSCRTSSRNVNVMIPLHQLQRVMTRRVSEVAEKGGWKFRNLLNAQLGVRQDFGAALTRSVQIYCNSPH